MGDADSHANGIIDSGQFAVDLQMFCADEIVEV